MNVYGFIKFVYISKKYYPNIWECRPSLSDIYPHELNRFFNEKYENDLYDIIINNSFIHKLSYKNKEVIEWSFKEYFLKKEI